MDKLILTYKGLDSWSRPVYEDDKGNLYCDVDPRPTSSVDICTKCNNAFDGEPDSPVRNKEIVLVPHRITW